MRKCLINGLVLASSLLLLGGCGTMDSVTKEDSAIVEDQGLSPEEIQAMDTEAKGIGASKGLGATPLGDLSTPGNPLSRRVIYFDFDSSEVKPEYRPTIEAHASYLASHPNLAVTLEGHADERGSREYNLALGERRAIAVRRLLGLLGTSEEQIRTVSYGEERPAAEGHDEQAWALNRRVEIIY